MLAIGAGLSSHNQGFEHLEEIIARYRRSWVSENLEHYFKSRAEAPNMQDEAVGSIESVYFTLGVPNEDRCSSGAPP